jgi:hypothetical protein
MRGGAGRNKLLGGCGGCISFDFVHDNKQYSTILVMTFHFNFHDLMCDNVCLRWLYISDFVRPTATSIDFLLDFVTYIVTL